MILELSKFLKAHRVVSNAEVMKASQQAIERGVKDFLFIDYKRRSGHFDVTTVASIKEITEKVCPVQLLIESFTDTHRSDQTLYLSRSVFYCSE